MVGGDVMTNTKEVFALRREGRLDEALQKARELYEDNPEDEWIIRAYGWVLISLIGKNKDSEDLHDYINELKELPEIEDDVFNEKREAACSIANPVNKKLQEIIQKSKDGDHIGALTEIRRLRNTHGGSKQIDRAFGWELWHGIRNELYNTDEPNSSDITSMFQEYGHLDIEKPSEIHSRMLDIAARAAIKDHFSGFFGYFLWWDKKNIREEDYNRNKKDGETYPSVVEHVIQALGHVCKKEEDFEKLKYAAQFIEENYEQYPDKEWFPYYLSLLWNKTGRNKEAFDLLLPVVRKKSGEYWAWQHLAECYPIGEAGHIQCLCKAVTCHVTGPEYLLKVRLELAEEFINSKLLSEAKFQIMKIKAIREEHDWGIKGRIEELLNLSWIDDIEENEGADLIRGKAQEAEKILIEGLPYYKAVIAVTKVEFSKNKKMFSIVDYTDEFEDLRTISVSHHNFPEVKKYKKGNPIEIIIDETQERPKVLGINDRSGSNWDINPKFVGLLYQVNHNKHLSMVKFTDGEKAFLYHNETNNANSFKVGDFVECKISKDRKRTKVRVINKYNENIESDYWKDFDGIFHEREQGGGHVNDIFIHANLCDGINDLDEIHGVAIKKSGDIGSKDWWTAISIKRNNDL